MSALWLRFLTILCVPCAALGVAGAGVEWKNLGGSITIRCRSSLPNLKSLNIKRGLQQEDILLTQKTEVTISKEVEGRVDYNIANFPSANFTIWNLTAEDTGPYWCKYVRIEGTDIVTEEGEGSLLLVVKEGEGKLCGPENPHLMVWIIVVASAALLLIITFGFFVGIILKVKTRKANQVTTSDVYEDMRGTLRR